MSGVRRRAKAAAAAACVAAAAALCGCAWRDAPPPGASDTAALADADRRFLLDAAAAGNYQVEAARLAELRAGAPPVKAYAALVGQQRAAAVEELRLLAAGRQLPWVGGVVADRRGALDGLAALSGAAFDRRYVEQVGVADLRAELAAAEAASRQLADPALRAYATRLLPMLQNHLATAQALLAEPAVAGLPAPG